MDTVSSRHEIDVRGAVGPIATAAPLAVSLEIPADVAGSPAAQHTAWALLNMLVRLERVVSAVTVVDPPDVPLRARLSPLTGGCGQLLDALRYGSDAVNVVPVSFDDRGDLRLVVGPGDAVSDGLRVYGEGWCGGFTRNLPIGPTATSALPFGPYIAAALAVGEVFKTVRIDADKYPPGSAAFYSLWSHCADTTFVHGGPDSIQSVALSETLAGVGAVGCICANVLWATDGIEGSILLVDGDDKGIDITNLNRYLLFGRTHVGKPKASTARDLLNGAGAIIWDAHDGPLESTGRTHRRVLCAVDTNPSRLAVQNRWPESLLMASTNELRAELVRCDPREGGPCARCFNPPAAATPDDELRNRFREATPEEQRALAVHVGADFEEALAWAATGECGTTGERVRDALRGSQGRTESFSAPFVSCAAGTMLAAEVVKEQLDAPAPLSPSVSRTAVQFWQPERSAGAKPYLRDPRCPVCLPDSDAGVIWRERITGRPRRSDAFPGDAGQ